jgi:nucleotide-binding universal stress UspA family protein
MPTIVVGVDGSDHAGTALRFAIEEAQLRNARLRLICAWALPVASWGEFPPPEETYDRYRREAEEVVAKAAAIVEKEAPSIECERLAPEGPAATVLLEHSSDASMLVIGSRGHGAVTGLLLGSVSQEVVQRTSSPVVVVPHQDSSD